MKLSVTQIVLGILILLAACYIVGWMIFGVPSLLTSPKPDSDGVMKNLNLLPVNEIPFTAARYASGVLFGLALIVLLTGAFQVRAKNAKKLAVTQVIAGVMIISISILISIWGYPTEFIIPRPAGSNLSRSVTINPGPALIDALHLTTLSFLLGLAVLGVAIAQFIKARNIDTR